MRGVIALLLIDDNGDVADQIDIAQISAEEAEPLYWDLVNGINTRKELTKPVRKILIKNED